LEKGILDFERPHTREQVLASRVPLGALRIFCRRRDPLYSQQLSLKRIDVLKQTLLAFLRQFSASRRGVGTGLGVPLLLIDGDDQPHERRFSLLTSDVLQDSAQAGRLVLCPNAAHFCWLFALLTLFTQAVCCLPAGIIAVFPAAVTTWDHLDRPLAVLIRAIG